MAYTTWLTLHYMLENRVTSKSEVTPLMQISLLCSELMLSPMSDLIFAFIVQKLTLLVAIALHWVVQAII